MAFPSLTIRSKLLLAVIASALFIGLPVITYSLFFMRDNIRSEFEDSALHASQVAAQILASNVKEVDTGCLAILATERFAPEYGCVLSIGADMAGRKDGFGHGFLAPTDHWKKKSNGHVLEITGPIETVSGKRVGYVKLAYDLAQVGVLEGALIQRNLGVVALAFLVGMGGALFFSRQVTRPIQAVVKASKSIEQGDLHTVIPMTGRDEMGQLGRSINGMASRLIETIRSRDFFDNVIESMVDALVVVDSNCNITTVNRATLSLLGYRKEELMGKPLQSLFLHDEPLFNPEALTFFEQNKSIADVEKEYRHHEGHGIPVLFSCSAFFEKDGTLRGLVCLALDQTERRKTQNELMNAFKEKLAAEYANQAKSDFVARVTHELRTPLNAILGYSEMVAEEARERSLDGMEADVRRIRRAGVHLLGLINDVLDISKIEAGKVDLCLETIDLRDMLKEVEETILPLAEKNGNRFLLDVSDELGAIHSDRIKIKQALINLLSNACKFCENGAVNLRVRADRFDSVSFVVYDEGIGMTSEQMERVWGAFEQADSFTTRDYGGTGLGLSITKHFVSMLGGKIAVDSKKGEWTEFTMTVPRKAPPISS